MLIGIKGLFEPQTAIVRRGKAHLAEFGRKVMLDEVDGGLLTRDAVLPGNPPDAPELATSLAHHQACFAQAPTLLTADRAFFTFDNERLAHRSPTPNQHEERRRVAFRRAYRWRAGIEGRISVLKRRFGLDRCRYHGETGMERWVGWGLLAHQPLPDQPIACHSPQRLEPGWPVTLLAPSRTSPVLAKPGCEPGFAPETS